MTNPSGSSAVWRRRVFWLSVVVLVAVQQYPGFWDSRTLVLDFLPAPLFYQVAVSLLAVVLWWVGTVVAWPDDVPFQANDAEVGGKMASREDGS